MISLGIVLIIISLITGMLILKNIGLLLLLVGLVLVLLGSSGRSIGGRRHYW